MKLINGECIEEMKKIKEESIDLIVCDPPFGTIRGMGKGIDRGNIDWDIRLNTEEMFQMCERVLRPNGVCVLFAQEPYTTELINGARPGLPFCQRAIWLKWHAANILGVNKNLVNLFEDVLIFRKKSPKYDCKGEHPLRQYFLDEKEKCGDANFSKILGNEMANHYFTGGAQFCVPTRENYEKLQTTGNFERDWEELKKIDSEYRAELIRKTNDKYPAVFNLNGKKQKGNVFEYKKEGKKYHPTQKPVLLLEDLITTYSNKGDVVLDFTMGSGSTGIACQNTGRDFIGIELKGEYYEIAKERMQENENKTLTE